MYEHHIDEMAEAVGKALAIEAGTPQADAVRAALDDYWRTRIALTWSVEDVLEHRSQLTEEEGIAVLQAVLAKADATQGVTWDTIHGAAVALYGDRGHEDDDAEEDEEDAADG